jgi:hypothetical protein
MKWRQLFVSNNIKDIMPLSVHLNIGVTYWHKWFFKFILGGDLFFFTVNNK